MQQEYTEAELAQIVAAKPEATDRLVQTIQGNINVVSEIDLMEPIEHPCDVAVKNGLEPDPFEQVPGVRPFLADPAYDHFSADAPVTRKVDLKLYQFPAEFDALEELLDESEGELTPEIEELLRNLQGDLETKVDNIVRLIHQKRAFAEARYTQMLDQSRAINAYNKSSVRLEDYLARVLIQLGVERMETPSAVVSAMADPEGEVDPVMHFEPKAPLAELPAFFSDPEEYSLTKEVGFLVEQVRQRQMLQEARKAEIKRLQELAEEDERQVKEFKAGIMAALRAHGQVKLETPEWKVRIQRNGQPSITVQDMDDLTPLVPLGLALQPPPPAPVLDTKRVRETWNNSGRLTEWCFWKGNPVETPEGVKVPRIEVHLGSHVRLQ